MILVLRKLVGRTLSARGGVWGALQTGVAQLGITAINIGTGVLSARALGPSSRGEFAAVMMWYLIPSLVATAGLQSGVVVLAQRDRERQLSLFVAGLMLGTAAFLPAAAACELLLPHLMIGYDEAAVRLARLAVIASGLNVGLTMARQSLLGARKTPLFNLSMLVGCAVNLLVLVVLVRRSALTVETALAAQVVATALTLIATAAAFLVTLPRQQARPFAVAAALSRFSIRAAPIDLSTVFYWNIDRLFLIALISPTQLGFYAVGTSFARLIGLIQFAVSSVALADMSSLSEDDRAVYVGRAIRILFWCLLAACILGWLAGPILLPAVYGGDFKQAVGVSQLLLIEATISCLAQLLIEALLAAGRSTYAAVVQVTFSVTLLIALLALAPSFGGIGAAAAMLVAAICKLALLLNGLERSGASWPSLVLPLRADGRR